MGPSGEFQFSFNRADIEALRQMTSMNLELLLLTKGKCPPLEKIVDTANISIKTVETGVVEVGNGRGLRVGELAYGHWLIT